MQLLDTYRSLRDLSREMVECARAKRWAELASLDARRQGLLELLPHPLPSLPASEGRVLAELIEEVLACHQEISRHALPWMETTSRLLKAWGAPSGKPGAG